MRKVADKEVAACAAAEQATAAAEARLAKFKSSTAAVATRIESETKSMTTRVRAAEERHAVASRRAEQAEKALLAAKEHVQSLEGELAEAQSVILQEQKVQQRQREQLAAAAVAEAEYRDTQAAHDEELARRTATESKLQQCNDELQGRLNKQLSRVASVGKELRETKGRDKAAQQELARLQSIDGELQRTQQLLRQEQEKHRQQESEMSATLAERDAHIEQLEQQLREKLSGGDALHSDMVGRAQTEGQQVRTDDNLHEATATASRSAMTDSEAGTEHPDAEVGTVSAVEMANILHKLQALHEDTMLSVRAV